jgi:hypothetical protein
MRFAHSRCSGTNRRERRSFRTPSTRLKHQPTLQVSTIDQARRDRASDRPRST